MSDFEIIYLVIMIASRRCRRSSLDAAAKTRRNIKSKAAIQR